MRLLLLYEAMSRRDFLKFLGGTAASAAGAPLEKVSKLLPGSLADPVGLVKKIAQVKLHVRFPSWERGSTDNLSGDLSELFRTWQIFKKVTGAKEVGIVDLDPYGSFHFTAQVNQDSRDLVRKWGLKNLPKDWDEARAVRKGWPSLTALNYTENDFFKDTGAGVLSVRDGPARISSAPASSWVDVVSSFVKETLESAIHGNEGFAGKSYFDKEGLEVLRDNGVDVDNFIGRYDDARSENERYREETRRLRDASMRTNLGPHERHAKFQFPGDEPKYEPKYSRGLESPFESKVRKKIMQDGDLEKELNEALGLNEAGSKDPQATTRPRLGATKGVSKGPNRRQVGNAKEEDVEDAEVVEEG